MRFFVALLLRMTPTNAVFGWTLASNPPSWITIGGVIDSAFLCNEISSRYPKIPSKITQKGIRLIKCFERVVYGPLLEF